MTTHVQTDVLWPPQLMSAGRSCATVRGRFSFCGARATHIEGGRHANSSFFSLLMRVTDIVQGLLGLLLRWLHSARSEPLHPLE